MKPTGEGSVGLLVLASSPGDEVVSAAAEALRQANATFAWIVARGTLREAMIATGEERVVPGPIEIVSASGTYRVGDEAIDLTAVIVAGGETLGGRFAMAVAEEVELVCFTAAPRAGAVTQAPAARVVASSAPVGGTAAAIAAPPAPAPPAPAPPTAPSSGAIELGPSTLEPRIPSPSPSDPGGSVGTPVTSTIPQKLSRKVDVEPTNTIEPEAGDRVTHFAFGDCDVESSDGDRIRLRQDKDERVREVSLAMLRIEAPTLLESGKRHFRLLRKN